MWENTDFHLWENIKNNYWIQDYMLQKMLSTFKKVVHKTSKATSELIENKIADAVTNSNGDKVVRQEPVEEERDEILIIIKMEHYKILKLLNDSIVSKFMPKKK